ncbi:AfsR/SARP family transcriptional regulator [Amycolatopsis suaedae]|uniref:AfsR/SARP family transcriptional regulator n=1 Tax=Amycolatopsis suaedae TaxID=2510978 RepID=UPI0013EF28B6|nr:BTAD domain-containing putative transcriptional regulator [Amycolatopsis suaedae]
MRRAVSFRVLGPVCAEIGGRAVPLPRGRVLTLLAGLLARANQLVRTDQLVRWLWDGDGPDNPKSAVHTIVRRLRDVLGDDVVRTVAGGYRLDVGAADLDLTRFTTAVARADALVADGDLRGAAAELPAALALWRGDPFDGVPSRRLRDEEGVPLAEQRLAARLLLVRVWSRLGEHALAVGELSALRAEYPLREEIRELLVRALHQAGRRAEALAEYHDTCRVLAAELGLDPSPSLRRLHREIVGADSAPPARFRGRDAELAELDRLLGAEAGVVVIVGAPGAGKTALALHWGDRAAERFPDGRLYVDLLGGAVRAGEALACLLTSLGVPAGRVPEDVDRASALLRSLLARRRALLVLDDAGAADQVRPLLPGATRSRVIVTSRQHLAGLTVTHSARLLRLEPLTLP